jgi:CheY-like chemotaxis protein
MKALVVEDEPVFRMDLVMRLRRMGFDCIDETPFGEEALRLVAAREYDVALIDVRLKDDTSGMQAARKISHERSLPIIITSAYQLDEVHMRESIPTLQKFVPKPVADEELRVAIQDAVSVAVNSDTRAAP